MTYKELLPCPFCGANEQGYKNGKTGKPMLEELCLEAGGGWRVMCYTCLVKNPHQIRPPFGNSGKTRLSKVEAVTLWNTRAPFPVTKAEAVEAKAWLRSYQKIAKNGEIPGKPIPDIFFETITRLLEATAQQEE